MSPIHCAGHTHRGRVRDRNEDAWACHEEIPLAVVADGMGGHPAGDVASRLAVDAVLDRLGSDATREGWGPHPGDDMEDAVREANRRILERGRRRPGEQGMGTTLTVLRLDPAERRYVVGHVGDSRAYLYRGGGLTPLTRDDSPLREQIEAGTMSREEARVHPLGHVLSQALGTQREVSPQVVEGEIRTEDLFLLCSDGLLAVLSEDRIRAMLGESRDEVADGAAPPDRLRTTAEDLVDEVLDGGAPDNVTVVLLEVSPDG